MGNHKKQKKSGDYARIGDVDDIRRLDLAVFIADIVFYNVNVASAESFCSVSKNEKIGDKNFVNSAAAFSIRQ